MDAKAQARARWREKNKDYKSPNILETTRKASLKYYYKNKETINRNLREEAAAVKEEKEARKRPKPKPRVIVKPGITPRDVPDLSESTDYMVFPTVRKGVFNQVFGTFSVPFD